MTNITMLYPINGTMTGPVSFIQYINQLTGFYFGPMIVLVFFLIVMFSLKGYETEKAFASASFSANLLAFLFFLINLVELNVVMMTTIMTIVSIFFLKKGQGSF